MQEWKYFVDHLPSIIAALFAGWAVYRVKELHIIINSRLSELLKGEKHWSPRRKR